MKAKTRKFLEDWIEALESGKYQQTSNCLRDKNGYCCLGVACKVAGLKFVPKPDDPDIFMIDNYNQEWQTLPYDLVCKLGLSDRNPVFVADDGISYSLAELNDDGKSFKEIAGYIRKYMFDGGQGVV